MAKAAYTGVDGIARKIKKMYVGIDGVARKVKKAYIGVNGVARLFYSSGLALADLPVGSLIKMNFAGAERNFLTVHQGKPSNKYDDSCDGTWLLMKDIYETRAWHSSNINRYKNSTIHSYLNSDFLGLFDEKVQSLIKQVKIPYVNGTGNSAVASGANGLDAKIFLLSGYEVGWTKSTNQYFPIDGDCLSYFSGTSATDSKRIAYLDGTATVWWLRSPATVTSRNAFGVGADGGESGGLCTKSYGIRPALVLPSDAMVNPTPNADGSYTLLV